MSSSDGGAFLCLLEKILEAFLSSVEGDRLIVEEALLLFACKCDLGRRITSPLPGAL